MIEVLLSQLIANESGGIHRREVAAEWAKTVGRDVPSALRRAFGLTLIWSVQPRVDGRITSRKKRLPIQLGKDPLNEGLAFLGSGNKFFHPVDSLRPSEVFDLKPSIMASALSSTI